MPPILHLRLLGGPQIDTGEPARADRILGQTKPLALLCYLAHRNQFVSRATVLGMFWPELDEERARAALRKTVFLIRRELGEGVVVNQGDGLATSALSLECDTVAYREAIRSGDRARALKLYAGELLPGFYVTSAAEFGRWVEEQRSNLHLAAERAALGLGRDALAAGEYDEALAWGRRAREISPMLNEGTALAMMAHHKLGNHSRALDEYERHARRLGVEYGISPASSLQELASTIRTAGRGAASASRRAELPMSPGAGDTLPVGTGGPERYRRFVETAADIMYETDTRGHFRWANPAVARVLGYSPEELVGRPYLNLVRGDYRDAALAFYLRQLQERQPSSYFEFPAVCADGREVWLGQSAQLLRVEGKLVGMQAVARDVTTQVRVAEAQRNLALRDHETDLYSPRGFHALAEDRIKLARRTDHKLVLLSAHASGVDEAASIRDLTALAGVLESTFRGSDVLARVADRQFAMLALERLDRDEAEWLAAVATRLRTAARARALPDRLVLSLGIAYAGPAEDCTADRLLSACASSTAGGGSRRARAGRSSPRATVRAG